MKLRHVILFLCSMLCTSHALASDAYSPRKTTQTDITKDLTFLRPYELRLHEADIDRVSKYLTGLTTIKANFSQLAPDGSITSGTFYLKRPGKMRWQYARPTPILIIANGIQLIFYDSELEQVNYLPIDDSLLSFISQKTIRFDGNVGITAMEKEDGILRLTLADRGKPAEGTIMLELSESPLVLKSLVVTDATGQVTTVLLSDAQFGVRLDNNLFIFNDPRKNRKR